jgi:hypothetical protein
MDTYTPDSTLVANAQGLGLAPVEQSDGSVLAPIGKTPGIARPVSQNVATGKATGAVFEYAPSGYDGHFVATMNPAAVADWMAFLSSFWATGVATVN